MILWKVTRFKELVFKKIEIENTYQDKSNPFLALVTTGAK